MEQWKQITYAPNYEISSYGNIRNNTRNGRLIRINYERLRKNNTRARPYLSVDGKSKGYYLHRIVADHFISNPDNLPEVNHKDGNFYNNRADNLEWISKNDNMRHAVKNNLIKRFKRKIIVKNKINGEITHYDSLTECASSLGYSNSTISNTCSGKRVDSLYSMNYMESPNLQIYNTNVSNDTIWREYPECSKYMVSTCGQVKNKKTNRIMMGSKVNGYRFLTLHINRDIPKLNRLVHRMVAQTFLPNPDDKPQVNHKDSNILNNCLDNLEWVTARENMNSHETLKNLKKGKENHMLLVGNPILQINVNDGSIVRRFDSASQGEEYELTHQTITNIAYYYRKIKENKPPRLVHKTYKKSYIFIFEEDREYLDQFLKVAMIDNSPCKKKIIQWNKNKTEKLDTFDSIYQAAKELDIQHCGISQCCNYYMYDDITRPKCYKLKSYKGYVFTFIE